ncbi:MAG: T9SS type A sorting domain-containing protein [Bacteroidales bacterium]|nr:T9SS type A sorting domain-containing protein [Bacteroidales bacterium]
MKIAIVVSGLLFFLQLSAQINIIESGGWHEAAYIKWTHVQDATSYNVYYSGEGVTNQKIDEPLIRNYGSCNYRADVAGIKAGNYTITVVPVFNGIENVSLATTTSTITVQPHVREGFAFVKRSVLGTAAEAFVPGAYNMDGTPKTGAKIIYVTAKNVNTVTCGVINERGNEVVVTGLANIIVARNKGYDKTPLIIRMIGTIKNSDITGLVGAKYIGFIGANTSERLIENITFEGIGDDATAYGFGFFTKRSRGIEIKNIGLMLWGGGKDGDAVSMEADNCNIWVHNCDFFYGAPGSDSDQKKGDGSIDMKYNTTNIAISYNHFFDSGKTTFAGGATEELNSVFFTYHHNWFDHTDSRNARICWGVVHMYNNYMDANPTMDLLNTEAASVFMEANKFNKCSYPMMINMQGSNYEKWPNGSQDGGMTKAFNNAINMAEVTKLLYQTDRATDFDAYLVSSRNETIPATVISRKGGNIYNNFDTDVCMYSYTPHTPDDVAADVTANAGRMNGGDFKWTFSAEDDKSTDINAALKTAITNYTSSLVFVQGDGTTPTNCTTDIPTTSASDVLIYPNPVKNIMNVEGDSKIDIIEIYNMSGTLMKCSNHTSVDISGLAPGRYFAVIITSNKKIRKLITKQ